MSKYSPPGLLVALPPHEPCGANGCGHHIPGKTGLVCRTRRTFKPGRRDFHGKVLSWDPVDTPGCGAVYTLNSSTGLREIATGETALEILGADTAAEIVRYERHLAAP